MVVEREEERATTLTSSLMLMREVIAPALGEEGCTCMIYLYMCFLAR
jgi:hypothetical protein